MSSVDTYEAPARPEGTRSVGSRVGRVAVTLAVVVMAVFWTWALFFASKEAVNKIDDRAWAARSERICQQANLERGKLSDLRVIDSENPDMVREHADIVDRSTDIVEAMLDDVVAVAPTDAKGIDIVPDWETEYRIYIQNRRDHAAKLRETGQNLPFYEADVDVPVSERLETFAGDNEMDSCAPPRDLSL